MLLPVITSQVSLSMGLLVVVLASCCTVSVYLSILDRERSRFLQQNGAILDAFNAREYLRHSLELGANRTLCMFVVGFTVASTQVWILSGESCLLSIKC